MRKTTYPDNRAGRTLSLFYFFVGDLDTNCACVISFLSFLLSSLNAAEMLKATKGLPVWRPHQINHGKPVQQHARTLLHGSARSYEEP